MAENQNEHIRTISIVLSVYDEEGTIENLVKGIVSTMTTVKYKFEIVLVNDGSTEKTVAELRGVLKTHPGVAWVANHHRNRGNGASLRISVGVAHGDIVVTMDADGQHAPEHIPRLLEQMPPYDLVIGVRNDSYRGSWYRGWVNRFYNRFASWLARREIKDLTTGFCAMQRHGEAVCAQG